ncbi:hypothetical protein OC845_004412 [Tilletia horrida]|nr:hypothetical protein OC845_004412 [Tilletia horrida]
MPLVPSRDPSPSRFPALPELSDLPDTQPLGGPAPWVHSSTSQSPGEDGLLPFSAMSPLVFGGGAFGEGMYNSDELIASAEPLKTIRLALRYGINAIDTSPYYHPSEFILGRVLRALRPEFRRESYFLLTKCGRYGPEKHHFDYSPERVRRSILHSCEALGTSYLDVAFMHDVEFVAEEVGLSHRSGMDAAQGPSNNQVQESLGIDPASASVVRGPGDLKVLAALGELFRLKDEGKVRAVGISGYPLPVLLRLARLVATSKEGPQRPLDVILSYSNHTLHSDILPEYMALFSEQPQGTIFNKSIRRRSPASVPSAEPRIVTAPAFLKPANVDESDFDLTKEPPFLSLPETRHFFARRSSFTGFNPQEGVSEGSDEDFNSLNAEETMPTPALSPSGSSPADSPAYGRSPLFAPMHVQSPIGGVGAGSSHSGGDALISWHPPLILNGSPFSMGLLTSRGPPPWHPAKPELRAACEDAARVLKDRSQELVHGIDGMKEARRRSRNASHTSLASLAGASGPFSKPGSGFSGPLQLGLAQLAEEEAIWRRAEARTDIEASVLLPADRFARAALAYGLRGAEISSRANRCWADATDAPEPTALFDYERKEPLLRTLTGLSTEAQVNDAIETFRILNAGRHTSDAAQPHGSSSADLLALRDDNSYQLHVKAVIADIQARLEQLALETESKSQKDPSDGSDGSPSDDDQISQGLPSPAAPKEDELEHQRYLRAFIQHCADEKFVLELMRERGVRRWSWASPAEA